MPNFGLFRKHKKEEQQTQEQEETPVIQEAVVEEKPVETLPVVPQENTETEITTYLKAMPLHELAELENIKNEVTNGNIIILRITPLASKSIEDVKKAVDELYAFAESIHGDIARLGEERIVICPDKIRIWREKTPVQKEPQKEEPQNAPLPTAA